MSRLTRRGMHNGLAGFWVKENDGSESFISWQDDGYDGIAKLTHYEDLEDAGRLMELLCTEGDKVWELCKCNDGVYRIFPMTVRKILPYGSVLWVKGRDPIIWHIYATSDYTEMYKSFYDFGKSLFITEEGAKEKLKELKGGGGDATMYNV